MRAPSHLVVWVLTAIVVGGLWNQGAHASNRSNYSTGWAQAEPVIDQPLPPVSRSGSNEWRATDATESVGEIRRQSTVTATSASPARMRSAPRQELQIERRSPSVRAERMAANVHGSPGRNQRRVRYTSVRVRGGDHPSTGRRRITTAQWDPFEDDRTDTPPRAPAPPLSSPSNENLREQTSRDTTNSLLTTTEEVPLGSIEYDGRVNHDEYIPLEGDYGDDGAFYGGEWLGAGCSDVCSSGCACGTSPCSCPRPPTWAVHFEFVFVKPRFEDNLAFTVMQSDGGNNETFNEAEFNYDLEVSPRVSLGQQWCNNLGYQATYWQFDHDAAAASASPPSNGFGLIINPPFRDVDISSNIPSDTYTARTSLDAFTVDLEATKHVDFQSWGMMLSGGLRYAEVKQHYHAELRSGSDTLRGQIDFSHHLKGIGPTVAMFTRRPITCNSSLFSMARGSLLYGDGESRLAAGEDLDLSTPFNTTQTGGRDDLLPIGELRLGYHWQRPRQAPGAWQLFMTTALEGQIWGAAGNATTDDGSLGFFGFTAGVGWVR